VQKCVRCKWFTILGHLVCLPNWSKCRFGGNQAPITHKLITALLQTAVQGIVEHYSRHTTQKVWRLYPIVLRKHRVAHYWGWPTTWPDTVDDSRSTSIVVWFNSSEECSNLVTWKHMFSFLFWLPNHRTPNCRIPITPELFKSRSSSCYTNYRSAPKETVLVYEPRERQVEGICHRLISSRTPSDTKTASYCYN
jgi:hypothetical protein